MKNLDNTLIQMRKGIIEFCVLQIIARDDVYAITILKELKEARLSISEGTLYPMLTRLLKAGFLQYTWQESSAGPPQKHYTITAEGRDFLEEMRQTWQGLVSATQQIIHKNS
ncbi:MAG: PadR family transcriptional regulator [Cytophagales bacterium]|nr:MAG: PadR family transcriptional regulator [Cytophagales bacterium]